MLTKGSKVSLTYEANRENGRCLGYLGDFWLPNFDFQLTPSSRAAQLEASRVSQVCSSMPGALGASATEQALHNADRGPGRGLQGLFKLYDGLEADLGRV